MKTISVQDAVALIPNGSSLMIGGFMGVGTPERLVEELVRQGKRDLVVIANDTAVPGKGIGRLVDIGLNPQTQKQMLAGTMAVDLVPQGTLIERIRAGGSGSVVFSRQPASVPLSRRGSERSKSPTKCIS
jgi:acetate CoA/acetoacetate CoA-transferase alpha subunit